jgi:hypothetical protein
MERVKFTNLYDKVLIKLAEQMREAERLLTLKESKRNSQIRTRIYLKN